MFEVIDTGIGIPEDKIDHIFESFSQADQTTTRRFGGTGLGLSVCQRLVTAMGGEITVRSKPGHGSAFRVDIPAKVATAAPVEPSKNVRVGTLLPAGLVKTSLEQMLVDLGCEIVSDGPDFWIAASARLEARSEPCIILTDIGDTQSDALLKDGRAADSLPNPYRRSEIAALLDRAQTGAFRGASAIQGGGEAKQLQSFEGLRVLAADDNAVNREVLREALATLKADAVFVEDGAEAVEACKTSAFDLIFMDGSMPVMDGFEATRQIRQAESESGAGRTPIYALTAQVAGTGDDAWKAAGADGHILKPFTLEKLIEVMNGVDISEPQESPVTPDRSSASLLDMDTIASLEKLGGGTTAVRDKVWTMFNEKAPAMLLELHAVMDAGDYEAIATKAHAFKSMALSSGLGGLARELQHIEEVAKAETGTFAASDQGEKISTLIDHSKTEMQAYQSAAV